jgi:hypothetical protein
MMAVFLGLTSLSLLSAIRGDNVWSLMIMVPFLMFGYLIFMYTLQPMLGVSLYSLTGDALVVHHGIGSTKIPFSSIERVEAGLITAILSHGGSRFLFVDSGRERLNTRIGSMITGGGVCISACYVRCVLLKMSKGGDKIALTPQDVDGFVGDLSRRVLSVSSESHI